MLFVNGETAKSSQLVVRMYSTHDVVILCPFIDITPDHDDRLVKVVHEILVEHFGGKARSGKSAEIDKNSVEIRDGHVGNDPFGVAVSEKLLVHIR